ncbi:MAG: protease modulator HflC [Proteobacteria bacterium]|nr:protease modulator HflC [Pseudomonadota bacterium]
MSARNLIVAIIVLGALFVTANSVFIVKQTERAILLRFGAVTRADVEPGLHFKIPIAEDIKIFDARVLTLDSQAETYFTLEKKPLIVDSFAKWRIKDVQKYYTASSGDERRARQVIEERVNEGLRNQISRRDMHEVISGERDQLMQELTNDLNLVMLNAMGVEVIDVRVKRIDLPPDVSSSVYERMNSERQIEARQYRAQGRELALGIRADADRQTVVISAEAYRESEQQRGEGDAKSAAIYANAFNKDPEFYEFYRSINAYAKVFGNKGDLLVLDPSSEFFKYLKNKTPGS